ncbi:uncharacterized protein LOC114282583 isoform X1 [Camellia sinensis]|uniref:uncharacterized protein LOC114282583 isoform X1 n=1 Tax=Camellia sinensis TaxID=4442 RepID=UPI001035EE60|nr:uncharacterized protein LOC114282583 isoform X1 [Camellia sinensis]XP_028081090.1 uncharacterized protein LOC114282583 isoform X1 [Camellia sinensis]
MRSRCYFLKQQLSTVVTVADDGSDSSPAFSPKRRELSYTTVEKVDKNKKFIEVVDREDKENDDWLPLSPKVSADTLKLDEDSTIKELRLRILLGYHFRQVMSILMWMMGGRRSLMKGCSQAIVLCQVPRDLFFCIPS